MKTYKDLLTRYTRLLPTIADFVLVQVTSCGIDVTIALTQCNLDCVLNLMWLRELLSNRSALYCTMGAVRNNTYPCSQANSRDLVPRVELEGASKRHDIEF